MDRESTAGVLRAARKKIGFNQVDFGRAVGLSQPTISRFEKGTRFPNLDEWARICEVSDIPIDSAMLGYIDSGGKVIVRSGQDSGIEKNFAIAKKYLENRGEGVRALSPLVQAGISGLGIKKFNKIIEELGVDSDLFYLKEGQINIFFEQDLFQHLHSLSPLNGKNLENFFKEFSQKEGHGVLRFFYSYCETQIDLVKGYVERGDRYQADYAYQVEEENSVGLTIAVKKNPHLEGVKLETDFNQFHCDYRKEALRSVSKLCGENAVYVHESECENHGAKRCLYHIKAAG